MITKLIKNAFKGEPVKKSIDAVVWLGHSNSNSTYPFSKKLLGILILILIQKIVYDYNRCLWLTLKKLCVCVSASELRC